MNRVRGLHIEFASTKQFNLVQLLSKIDLDGFAFYTGDDMVFPSGTHSLLNMISIPEFFNADCFYELFQRPVNVEILSLFLYPNGSKRQVINTYDAYCQSECRMVLLAYDYFYLDIYCKDMSWIAAMCQVLNSLPGTVYTVITDDNDTRTRLSV